MSRNPILENILNQIKETHEKKNEDYAGDKGVYFNFDYAAKMAEPFKDPILKTFVTLLGIKLARLAVLTSSNTPPNNESIEDSFRDFTTYAAIATAWWFGRDESNTSRENEYGREKSGSANPDPNLCTNTLKINGVQYLCDRVLNHEGPHRILIDF